MFWKGHLDMDTISHEASHAAFGYARIKCLNPTLPDKRGMVSNEEEDFCIAQGIITQGIVDAVREVGLKP